jgi:hypothetical protein
MSLLAEGREEEPIEFSWVGETARHVGTVVHRWLQRIAEDELRGWNAGREEALKGALVMDGVFRDADGMRWIVGYKTSRHEGGDVEAFLDRERDRYAAQLAFSRSGIGGRASTSPSSEAGVVPEEHKPRQAVYWAPHGLKNDLRSNRSGDR